MNRFLGALILGLFLGFLLCPPADAGGAAARKRRGRVHQQVNQKAMMEKMIIEKRMMEQKVAQEVAKEQYRVQQMAIQQQAVIQRQIQQKVAEKAVQQQVQKMAVDVAVEARLQHEMQARNTKVEEVVSLDQILQSFDQSSEAWNLMIDREAKEAVVSTYIDRYRRQGVAIRKSPDHYAAMINSMASESPPMLAQPFPQILQVVAIIEYDFNNGQDQDSMAMQVLGSYDAVLKNRQRLGLP